MYVEKLTIENFKCFEKAELELNYPGRPATEMRPVPKRLENVNLLLGGNGSGKSSVFKAIALSVLGSILGGAGFKPELLVRRQPDELSEEKEGYIFADFLLHTDEIQFNQRTSNLVHILSKWDSENIASNSSINPEFVTMFMVNHPSFFLTGYGANRRTERPENYSGPSRTLRYQRVAGLFEDYVGLVPFIWGFLQLLNLNRLTESKEILNSLLPTGIQISNELDNLKRPLFNCMGVMLPFEALSDGVRTFIGWVWDLQYQMALVQPQGVESIPFREMTGVCIVDEIDLFLHPEWQRKVIEQVATTFLKLQFLFSTHSPLVAGTLEPENIFVMEQEPDGTATVKQYRENIYGLTANQVLTSSYFGLDSTRAPNTGTLSDLAEKSIAFKNGGNETETGAVAPLADAQKEMLSRLMEQSKQYEAVLQPAKKGVKASVGRAKKK